MNPTQKVPENVIKISFAIPQATKYWYLLTKTKPSHK